jgi:hypothetical protein
VRFRSQTHDVYIPQVCQNRGALNSREQPYNPHTRYWKTHPWWTKRSNCEYDSTGLYGYCEGNKCIKVLHQDRLRTVIQRSHVRRNNNVQKATIWRRTNCHIVNRVVQLRTAAFGGMKHFVCVAWTRRHSTFQLMTLSVFIRKERVPNRLICGFRVPFLPKTNTEILHIDKITLLQVPPNQNTFAHSATAFKIHSAEYEWGYTHTQIHVYEIHKHLSKTQQQHQCLSHTHQHASSVNSPHKCTSPSSLS